MTSRNLTKQLISTLFVFSLLIAGIQPAMAIQEGELDGDAHPYVGIMIAKDANGTPMWRCSGALVSEKLFLTAGHCTEAPAASVTIWFDADMTGGYAENGYPYDGDVDGTPYTHPLYYTMPSYFNDLGVVVLDKKMKMDEYATLPELDILDEMATQRGLQDVTFTAVGYGVQRINPVFYEAVRIRMVAHPHLVQINTGFTGDYSVMLSNNHSTGGTCFGDSGGPNFIGDSNVIGGITSFVKNGNCAGSSGVYRLDRADDLDWLYSEFGDLL